MLPIAALWSKARRGTSVIRMPRTSFSPSWRVNGTARGADRGDVSACGYRWGNACSTGECVPAALPAVRRKWVMTMRSKYLHTIRLQEDGIYTACEWRKGANALKPIDEERIL